MQKKLIALAVAALATGSAFAQSNVAISGNVSSGFSQYKMTGTGSTGYKAENHIDDGRLSRIRFTGTEDLGGGLKAEFQIETRFMQDTPSAVASLGSVGSGDTWVGLNGAFGRVRLGRMDTYYSDGILVELNRAGSFASHATLSLLSQVHNGGYVANPGRHNNQVRYDSPNFSGFSGTLAYSTRDSGGDEGTGAAGGSAGGSWYASGRYFNGPIYVGASYFTRQNEGASSAVSATNQDADAWRLYGSYTFPFGLKIGAMWDDSRVKYANGFKAKRTAWQLPVSYTFGNNAVYLTYARANKATGDGATHNNKVANSNANFWTLGYDYALSKRTSVGATYTQLKNNDGASYDLFLAGALGGIGGTATTASGMDARQIYIGMNHNF